MSDSQPKDGSRNPELAGYNLQQKAETNIGLFTFLTLIVVSIAGIVEIIPQFTLDATNAKPAECSAATPDKCLTDSALPAKYVPGVVWQRQPGQSLDDWKPGDGVRPGKPIEIAGRDVFIREGCYLCHSQMIRPFRDEAERYGHYSLASESMYDHPFQWGSKRTGPDLARVGGKYSDEWHRKHLMAPRSVVPESVMPNYPWLFTQMVDAEQLKKNMAGLRAVGVPYTDADIASASNVAGTTEIEAVIAYLQSLGNHINFQEGVTYRE